MGNSLLCEKCEPPKVCKESVIDLSDHCIDRLTKDKNKSKLDEKAKDPKEEDDEWMKKLKCLDDIHSNNYGLNIHAVEELLKSLEAYFSDVYIPPCSARQVLICLKRNPTCTIRCKGILDQYIDCIDTLRVQKIKERVEHEKILRMKEEQEKEEAKRLSKEKGK